MIHYNNPKVQTIPNPTPLDAAIAAMQGKFAELDWLQTAFGACKKQTGRISQKEQPDRRVRNEFTYPEGIYKGEPFNLMPNDNLNAFCFFHPYDNTEFPDYEGNSSIVHAVQPLAIIFWGNLSRINKEKDYIFTEELRIQALAKLAKVPAFILESSAVEYENVFSPFTLRETYRQFLKFPFFGFRFDGRLNYSYKLQPC